MQTVKRFDGIKELLWDSVDAIIVHEGTDTEYELNLKLAKPEVKLLRAIFNSEDLDALTVDGIMVSETGFILSAPFTAENIGIITTLSNKYNIRIKKTTFM